MKQLTSHSDHGSSHLESCLKSNFHNANACITSRLRLLVDAEKIKRTCLAPVRCNFFYFKILIIEQVGYLGGSSEITLMFIMYHHNIIV